MERVGSGLDIDLDARAPSAVPTRHARSRSRTTCSARSAPTGGAWSMTSTASRWPTAGACTRSCRCPVAAGGRSSRCSTATRPRCPAAMTGTCGGCVAHVRRCGTAAGCNRHRPALAERARSVRHRAGRSAEPPGGPSRAGGPLGRLVTAGPARGFAAAAGGRATASPCRPRAPGDRPRRPDAGEPARRARRSPRPRYGAACRWAPRPPADEGRSPGQCRTRPAAGPHVTASRPAAPVAVPAPTGTPPTVTAAASPRGAPKPCPPQACPAARHRCRRPPSPPMDCRPRAAAGRTSRPRRQPVAPPRRAADGPMLAPGARAPPRRAARAADTPNIVIGRIRSSSTAPSGRTDRSATRAARAASAAPARTAGAAVRPPIRDRTAVAMALLDLSLVT